MRVDLEASCEDREHAAAAPELEASLPLRPRRAPPDGGEIAAAAREEAYSRSSPTLRRLLLASAVVGVAGGGAAVVTLRRSQVGPVDRNGRHDVSGATRLERVVDEESSAEDGSECSETGANCVYTQCCQDPDDRCYEKSPGVAVCKHSCKPGVDPNEPKSLQTEWTCKELGRSRAGGKEHHARAGTGKTRAPADKKRAEPSSDRGESDESVAAAKAKQSAQLAEARGDAGGCSQAGEECASTRCCSEPGFTCFQKHEHWAVCKESCTPGEVDLSEPPQAQSPWSCVEVAEQQDAEAAERAPAAGEPLASSCSSDSQDCTESRCCSSPGTKCYEKLPGIGFCMTTCTPEQDWNERTPLRIAWTCSVLAASDAEPAAVAPPRKLPAPPRTPDATGSGIGVSDTTSSAPVAAPVVTALPEDTDTKTTGVASITTSTATTTSVAVATVGTTSRKPGEPSLYCFALMLPDTYEVGLLQEQLEEGVGMFLCDAYTVLSSRDVELRAGPPRVGTEIVPGSLKCEIGGEYMTALNSEIFVRVWKKVASVGVWRQYDWTVKLDPDCVFIPSRLRTRLKSGSPDAPVYINNFEEGLHGPIEVLSMKAMEAYDQGMERCVSELKHEWTIWGEDVFLRHCLGLLGVGRVDDFTLLTETFDHSLPDCDTGSAAFHPLKKVEDWFECLRVAEK